MENKKDLILEKIIPLHKLLQKVHYWRIKGASIVFTNGCFDLLHPGHLEILLRAADQGNRLIVGLNSDTSVKQLKGKNRPVLKEQDRAFLLAGQTFVDAVTIFEEETPIQLIKAVKPDILVKGGDYKENEVVGADFMNDNNGKTVIIPLVEGMSTSGIIEKMRQSS